MPAGLTEPRAVVVVLHGGGGEGRDVANLGEHQPVKRARDACGLTRDQVFVAVGSHGAEIAEDVDRAPPVVEASATPRRASLGRAARRAPPICLRPRPW